MFTRRVAKKRDAGCVAATAESGRVKRHCGASALRMFKEWRQVLIETEGPIYGLRSGVQIRRGAAPQDLRPAKGREPRKGDSTPPGHRSDLL